MSSVPWASEEQAIERVGLDIEALWWEDKGSCPWLRVPLCISFGTGGRDLTTIEAAVPGVFDTRDLELMLDTITREDIILVGHNLARYDLPLLQGILRADLTGIQYQDTMGNLKSGRGYRNTLRDQCAHYDINLKQAGPNWLKIIQGDVEEWEVMVEYCENDVECTLQLERALWEDGLPVPIRKWRGKKAAA